MQIIHDEISDAQRNEIYKDFAAINEKYGLVQDDSQKRISSHIQEGEAIIAYASGLKHGNWFTITDLWTHKSYRRKGLATALLQGLLDKAIENGCTNAHLRTQGTKNETFYEGFGFKEMGRLDQFGGKPAFDSVFYQMPIG